MKFKFSTHAKDVMSNRSIKIEWVESVLNDPFVTMKIDEEEIHLYHTIEEYGGRCLKVVVNPLKNVIITTYFDRKMKKKGCK